MEFFENLLLVGPLCLEAAVLWERSAACIHPLLPQRFLLPEKFCERIYYYCFAQIFKYYYLVEKSKKNQDRFFG